MAYNNGFPVNYAQYYPQYQQTYQPQQQQPMNSSIIWVQGEAGAKSYLVAPNNTVQLWDSESQTIYLKSADASGMPSMKILDYKIRSEGSQMPQNAISQSNGNIPTMRDLEALQGQIDALKEQMEMMGGKNNVKSDLSADDGSRSKRKQRDSEIHAIQE